MQKTLKTFLLGIVILLLIAACSSGGDIQATEPEEKVADPEPEDTSDDEQPEVISPTATDEPTITPELTPEPTNTPEPEMVIYWQDDFSDVESGWERTPGNTDMFDYDQDGYRIKVGPEKRLYWVTAALEEDLGSVIIQTSAQVIGGPEKAQFGIMCRLSEDFSSYYAILITSDGQAAIALQKDWNYSILTGDGNFVDVPQVTAGTGPFEILAVCGDDSIQLLVNGELALEAVTNELEAGKIGLFAGTFEEGGVDVLFDDYTVYLP